MANTYNHPERLPKKRSTMFETTEELCKVPEEPPYEEPKVESISADEYLDARKAPDPSKAHKQQDLPREKEIKKEKQIPPSKESRAEEKRAPKLEPERSSSSSSVSPRKHCHHHHSQREELKREPPARPDERASSRSQQAPPPEKETRRHRSRSRDHSDHTGPHRSPSVELAIDQIKGGELRFTIHNDLYSPSGKKARVPDKKPEVQPAMSEKPKVPRPKSYRTQNQSVSSSSRNENTQRAKSKPRSRSRERQRRSTSRSRRPERPRDDSRNSARPEVEGVVENRQRERRSRSRPRRQEPPPEEEILNELKPISELSQDQLVTFQNEVQSFQADSLNLLTKMGIIHIIPPTLLGLLEQYGYEKLTELQREVWWNIAQRHHDTLTIACVPHSERILAYLLPAIVYIADWKYKPRMDPQVQGPLVLILLPTTEMVDFVHLLAKQFCIPLNCSEIAIATPKSVVEMLRVVNTTLERCTYLVFDELHRMLSAGMISDLSEILRVTNANPGQKIRKSFSSQNTIYEQLFAEKLINAKLIETSGFKTKGMNAFSGIHQYVQVLEDNQSMRPEMTRILTRLLVAQKDQPDFKTIIFVSQLPSAMFVEKVQEKLPLWAPKILCPEKGQSAKDCLIGFCKWGHQILIATDDMIGQISEYRDSLLLLVRYNYCSIKVLRCFSPI
jgi:DEAD/DEAH box helicase